MKYQKTRLIVLASFLITVAPQAFGQKTATLPDAKDVVAKSIKATGGADAFKAIKSRVVKGKMNIKQAGISGDLTTTTGGDGKFYTEVNLGGIGQELMGGDGETYWSKSAFTGVRVVEGSERAQYEEENDFTSQLHPEKYYKSMKVTGVEKVGDDDCFRVEKIKINGDEKVDFYSIETGLLRKSVIPAVTPLGKINVEALFEDYRKVGDFTFSFKSTQKLPANMTQEVTIEEIELDVEIPKEKFALPEEIQKLKAKQAKKKAAAAK